MDGTSPYEDFEGRIENFYEKREEWLRVFDTVVTESVHMLNKITCYELLPSLTRKCGLRCEPIR